MIKSKQYFKKYKNKLLIPFFILLFLIVPFIYMFHNSHNTRVEILEQYANIYNDCRTKKYTRNACEISSIAVIAVKHNPKIATKFMKKKIIPNIDNINDLYSEYDFQQFIKYSISNLTTKKRNVHELCSIVIDVIEKADVVIPNRSVCEQKKI